MKKIVVLGAGLMGKAMAKDLAKDYQVTAVDVNPKNLEGLQQLNIETKTADLSQADTIKSCVAPFDLVVLAVPGFMGFDALKAVIEAKKDVADISFCEEDFFLLDDLAKENGVTAVVDCGVAPGLGNIILGHHTQNMQIDNFECLVGGLPTRRSWPYEYKAPFSPIDVIEEYTRPARIMENGQIVIKEALSETEHVEFPEIGTLESFNSDGLRTLLKTMQIPNMKEKTLRYPGRHIEYMKVLRETGLFSKEEISVKGNKIRPIDLTAQLLFPKWKFEEKEHDFTVMRITIEGKENGENKKYVYNMLDRYCSETDTTSMAKTTGYTCTGAARLIAEGHFTRKGICPPEYVGQHEDCLTKILAHLKERNVNVDLQQDI
ncbi:saccharopine dehydrogenase family protein [Candidatus Uabimicrobium amorphum]|uniref:Saccharopine dehydrogenase n=1 Tax=Uabimicrobium amorphum TaxID=2596890 RepID=A0A5S9F6J8_UABAM|nr:saccharopine dehydrogenase C-terminal domain-containing protein [Candidatus Uabimicrobium amorphum]BBM87965.1 saccharopine dehydrogenase [Candidatus Uabimicrobium amorphum]